MINTTARLGRVGQKMGKLTRQLTTVLLSRWRITSEFGDERQSTEYEKDAETSVHPLPFAGSALHRIAHTGETEEQEYH